MKCKTCGTITKSNIPNGRSKLWAWITDIKGNKIGKRTLSETPTCMKCNMDVLLK